MDLENLIRIHQSNVITKYQCEITLRPDMSLRAAIAIHGEIKNAYKVNIPPTTIRYLGEKATRIEAIAGIWKVARFSSINQGEAMKVTLLVERPDCEVILRLMF